MRLRAAVLPAGQKGKAVIQKLFRRRKPAPQAATPTDLELLTTDQLVDEIGKRFDAVAVLATTRQTAFEQDQIPDEIRFKQYTWMRTTLGFDGYGMTKTAFAHWLRASASEAADDFEADK